MIAIKDMEMPKSCAECSFVVDDMCGDATCVLLCDEWKDNENRRAENCPLVEIVTCKDCELCEKDEIEGIEHLWCNKDDCNTSEDYYCGGWRE